MRPPVESTGPRAAAHFAARLVVSAAPGRVGAILLALAALVPVPARSAPAGLAPCTWHVRLNYHYRDAGPQGQHDTQVLLSLEAPLRCAGSGAESILIPGGPVVATGRARVLRNVAQADGAPAIGAISAKEVLWPSAAAADPAPGIEPPAPSFVGAGFGTKVIIVGALSPAQPSAIADDAALPALPSPDPHALTTTIEPDTDADHLHLELFVDPLPGPPMDPAGALARVPERTRAALAAPGGEAALALKGHLYGATTAFTEDGNFSICYQRTLTLAPARLAVDFCGWLTRSGQDWTPARLPPMDASTEH